MSYDTTVLADAPQAYWKLNEANGSSTVADSSGNGFTATKGTNAPSPGLGQASYPAAISTTTLGLSGANGASGYWFSPTPTGNLLGALQAHDFSAEAWVLRSAALSGTTPNVIFVAGNANTTDQVFQFRYDTSSFYMGFWSDDWQTGFTISQNAWAHAVFAFNHTSKVATFYVNGVSQGTHTYGAALNVNANAWGIGGAPNTSLGWNSWTGNLSRFAIYNTALSQSQVLAHYNAAFGSIFLAMNT